MGWEEDRVRTHFGWAGCGTGEKVKKEQSKKQEVRLYGQRLAEIDFQEEV